MKLLSLNNITIRQGNTFFFENTSWELFEGQHYVIMGENGAGKTTFAKALAGLLPLKHGEIILHFLKDKHPYPSVHKKKIAYISFDTQDRFIQKEEQEKNYYSFVGKNKKGMTIKQFLPSLSNLPFAHIPNENRELSSLSTGEQRKVFLLKAIQSHPKIIILDEPFDGLDTESCKSLTKMINTLSKTTPIILITHRNSEIPSCMTHLMQIKDGKIHTVSPFKPQKIPNTVCSIEMKRAKPSKVIISLHNVTVTHGKNQILKSITWKIQKGENWAVVGHNGAGKSTLLKLLYGDEQQAYANDIFFFKKHKKDISLSEIRKRISYISSDLLYSYHTSLIAQEVIFSGFFDSIGLYKKASPSQKLRAENIIKDLKLEKVVDKKFELLSFGQKRLVLIARAVVKQPQILILDEPFHGLDKKNKKIILDYLGKLGEKTHFIISSHSDISSVPNITNILHLKNGEITLQYV